MATAQAELPVVKDEYGNIQVPVKQCKVFQPMADVAGVAMEPEQGGVYVWTG